MMILPIEKTLETGATMAAELETIKAIATRACTDLKTMQGRPVDFVDVLTTVKGVNRVCPLDLPGLLNADAANFAHDIHGMLAHYDFLQSKLLNFFEPRFSRADLEA